MINDKFARVAGAIVLTALMTGCSSPNATMNSQAGESGAEESICTTHANLVTQYENLIGFDGKFFAATHADIFGTKDTMRAVGEPEPEANQYLLKKRIEFVANSAFAEQCFSSSLRQAMLDYVNN